MVNNKKELNDEELTLVSGGCLPAYGSYDFKYKNNDHVQYKTYSLFEKRWETFEGEVLVAEKKGIIDAPIIYAIQRFPIPNVVDAVIEENIICKI